MAARLTGDFGVEGGLTAVSPHRTFLVSEAVSVKSCDHRGSTLHAGIKMLSALTAS